MTQFHRDRSWCCPSCALIQSTNNAQCEECGWDGFTTAAQRERETEERENDE